MAEVPLDHIAVQIYGPRHQLLGHCRIPAADVPKFMELVQLAQGANPAYTEASLFRWLVRAGHRGVAAGIATVIKNRALPVPTGE